METILVSLHLLDISAQVTYQSKKTVVLTVICLDVFWDFLTVLSGMAMLSNPIHTFWPRPALEMCVAETIVLSSAKTPKSGKSPRMNVVIWKRILVKDHLLLGRTKRTQQNYSPLPLLPSGELIWVRMRNFCAEMEGKKEMGEGCFSKTFRYFFFFFFFNKHPSYRNVHF